MLHIHKLLYGHIRCGSGKLFTEMYTVGKKEKKEKREAPADCVDVDCDTFKIKNISPIYILNELYHHTELKINIYLLYLFVYSYNTIFIFFR